jgi:phosphoribosylanthranilate isomerase
MTVVKVCGVTSAADPAVAAEGGADLVGLWHGVPGGHADLPANRLGALVRAAVAVGVKPVLVTLLPDMRHLAALIRATAVPLVQLHGYQPPAAVRRLKREVDVIVVKVLHAGPDGCPEQELLGAYRRAGTDLFLIDAATSDGRLGSTGRRVPPGRARALADRGGLPFLLAGGLGAGAGIDRSLRAHPLFHGIDVDSGARDASGRLDRRRIAGLVEAGRAGPGPA